MKPSHTSDASSIFAGATHDNSSIYSGHSTAEDTAPGQAAIEQERASQAREAQVNKMWRAALDVAAMDRTL